MTIERRSAPIMILSLAFSMSSMSTIFLFERAAKSAASLTRLARSAPEKPGVPRARIDALTSSAAGILRICTFRICSRPRTSGQRHDDLSVESAGAQEGRIEHVGTVGRRDDDNPLVALESVHLDQKLVEGLLALVVTAAQAGPAMPTDRVDLVDEDDAGRMLLRLLEHIPDPRGADTDEHLDEVRAGDGEEGNLRLARDGTRKQRLARSGRTDHQHALRDLAAEFLELGWIAQEIHHFGDLFLGLLGPGHVLEGHLDLILRKQPGAALAEGHGTSTARTALHLPHEEDPDPDQDQQREPVDQNLHQDGLLLGRRCLDDHVVVQEVADESVVTRAEGGESLPRPAQTLDRAALDRDFLDLARPHLIDKVGIGQGARCRGRGGEIVEDGHQHDGDDHPKKYIFRHVIHGLCPC
jgi:hypothetical protein